MLLIYFHWWCWTQRGLRRTQGWTLDKNTILKAKGKCCAKFLAHFRVTDRKFELCRTKIFRYSKSQKNFFRCQMPALVYQLSTISRSFKAASVCKEFGQNFCHSKLWGDKITEKVKKLKMKQKRTKKDKFSHFC